MNLDAQKKPAFRGTLPPPPASPMDLDAEIKEAQDRVARRIGQWGRRDGAIRKRQVAAAQQETETAFRAARIDIMNAIARSDIIDAVYRGEATAKVRFLPSGTVSVETA